ncbi:single-stranded DNA-binding protein, partial [Methylobacterium sp. WL18]
GRPAPASSGGGGGGARGGYDLDDDIPF